MLLLKAVLTVVASCLTVIAAEPSPTYRTYLASAVAGVVALRAWLDQSYGRHLEGTK